MMKLRGQPVTLSWTNRAQYRIGTIGGLPDITQPEQRFAAICAWAWAMLPRHLARLYKTPEDLAEDITPELVGPLVEAVNAALGGGKDEDDDEEVAASKNTSTDCEPESASQSE